MTEGTLLAWHVAVGTQVHRGDIVATVDTAKSAIDIEVFEDGRVAELLIEPGVKVSVGTPIAVIDTVRLPGLVPELVEPTGPVASGRVHASPLARRRAAERGIDLAAVRRLRPEGIITAADVEAAAQGVPVAPSPVVSVPQPGASAPDVRAREVGTRDEVAMRASIGALMARSKREIPHYYLQTTVDVEPMLAWLERGNAERAVSARILPAAVLLRATARAAARFPAVNGWFDTAFSPADRVHPGVAISLRGGGVIAPAIHDAGLLPLPDLMAHLKDLVLRARSGRLRASEMTDATLTVTNLGEQGVEVVHGVIFPPQVALVGFGTVIQRPWAIDGMLTVRRVITISLAADHRVSDGHLGGAFLQAIAAGITPQEEA